ncbi:hypothetical protein D9758_006884 [Tetrapyrgos nigripes]|uniref:glutathione transferase n=1 Tax=Tetrapyrgos nigripes TaxID=182062 RepID=A0A8H5GSC2_9AGAR|nr:hypothetical protein D9758_006884 [Tetrapyrgos nigripes]
MLRSAQCYFYCSFRLGIARRTSNNLDINMVLTIYGIPRSTSTKRIVVVCKEKNIPYRIVSIKMLENEHKTPAFLEKQPFGQIPYVVDEDDGFMLFESRAICRYIANKYASQGTPLIPTDPKELAIFEQAASFELNNFEAIANPLYHEKVIHPIYHKIPTNESFVAHYVSTLNQRLDGYERILSKQTYICGEKLTLVDLFHLSFLDKVYLMLPETIDSRPNVARWYQALSQRPTWVEIKDTAPESFLV